MTNGGAEYPIRGIANFKSLMNKHPDNFMYFSILLGGKNQLLDTIANDLKGKNTIAIDPKQLLGTYKSIVYEVVKS
jgi:hypothetical protein